METERQRFLRDALNGASVTAEQAQEQQFLQLNDIRSHLAIISAVVQWCAIFLAIICAAVVYKLFKG